MSIPLLDHDRVQDICSEQRLTSNAFKIHPTSHSIHRSVLLRREAWNCQCTTAPVGLHRWSPSISTSTVSFLVLQPMTHTSRPICSTVLPRGTKIVRASGVCRTNPESYCSALEYQVNRSSRVKYGSDVCTNSRQVMYPPRYRDNSQVCLVEAADDTQTDCCPWSDEPKEV